MDIFERIKKHKGPLGENAEKWHGYFTFPKLEGEIGPYMTWRGKKVLTWSLNNYLGLANDPVIRKADADSAAKWGLAYPMGSRMLSGNTSVHEEFERKVSKFIEKEDSFLVNFGYQAMVSVIQALATPRDVIVYDQLSHACILDGMLLSGSKRFVFKHNDIEQFEDRLKKATAMAESKGGGVLVITEGVFGMKGDLGILDQICELKSKYNFRVLVDDAHGFGVMGKQGRGTPDHFNCMDKIDVYFATFAKSMASVGAFISATHDVVNYLRYNMRSQVFAKSLPMVMAEGAIVRLDALINAPHHRENLWNVVNTLQSGLKERGFDIGVTQSPVTPVYLKGGFIEATGIMTDLRENLNVFVSAVTYPVIEKGELLLRLIPTAAHTEKEVKITLEAFDEVRPKLESGGYSKGI